MDHQKNLIVFVKDSDLRNLCSSWTSAFLQPQTVNYAFYASDKESFEEITKGNTQWQWLILDEYTAVEYEQALATFLQRQPTVVTLILSSHPVKSGVKNTKVAIPPSSGDDWIDIFSDLQQS